MSTYTTDTDAESKEKTPDEKLLEKAKRFAKRAWEAEADQRKREMAALKFCVGEYQWDEAAKAQRAGGMAGSQVVPPRPMVSIPKLDQPIQLVQNQARQAKFGINIVPVSEEANDDTAKVFQGIYRRIERDSNANQGRLWALDRGSKCGRGVWRVNTKFDEDAPEGSFDQEIVIERILHQDSVYFDPSAERPDFSDGDEAIECLWMTPDRFKREFPDAEFPISTEGAFAELASAEPDWVDGEGDERQILVVVYWYKEHEIKVVERGRDKAKFKRDIITVKRCWLTALEVLEKETWNGRWIPLIPYIGKELQPFDADRRYVGMIEPNMDAVKVHNVSASNFIERMMLEPRVPWVMAEGQDAGYETEWLEANIRNRPVLHYRMKTLNGEPAPPPARTPIDQAGMSLAAQGMEISNDWIQSGTGIYDPSLGRQNPRDKSGRAILALQQQADAGNNHFLASLADTSLPYEARVILDLIPKIYDRPGRVAQILGEEDDVTPVMLNAPYRIDTNTGRPIRADNDPNAKTHNLKDGRYTVSVSIGKSYQTARQQGQEEIGAILQADPALMPLIGPVYFRHSDFPGAREIADVLKEVRDKQYPGLGAKKDEEPNPEQLKAQAQAAQQHIQQLTQQLQQAAAMIQTEHAKQQAHIQTAQIKAQADVEIVRMNNATKLAVARITAAKESMDAAKEDFEERLALGQEQAHEAQQSAQDRAHEVAMAAMGAQHAQDAQAQAGAQDQAMQAQGGAQDATLQAGQQAHEGQMQASDQQASAQQQAADLAAQPQADGAGE